MKKTTMLAIVVAAVATAQNPQTKPDGAEWSVAVCLFDNAGVAQAVRYRAQRLATQMFAGVGVNVNWCASRRSQDSNKQSIAIDLETRTPKNLLPGALAYARPYEGAHIVVFMDRLSSANDPVAMLGHVLVHEITHILQRSNRHSDSGVMKASWGSAEYRQMRTSSLAFTEGDVMMIRNGLNSRVGGLVY